MRDFKVEIINNRENPKTKEKKKKKKKKKKSFTCRVVEQIAFERQLSMLDHLAYKRDSILILRWMQLAW